MARKSNARVLNERGVVAVERLVDGPSRNAKGAESMQDGCIEANGLRSLWVDVESVVVSVQPIEEGLVWLCFEFDFV